MKRISTLVAALAAVAVLAVAAPAAEAAPTCSTATIGTPYLGGGVHADGSGKCSVQWIAWASLRYESGGSWHVATQNGGTPVAPQPEGPFGTGAVHAISYDWGNLDQTPYCSFRWRVQTVDWTRASDGLVIVSKTSAILPISC